MAHFGTTPQLRKTLATMNSLSTLSAILIPLVILAAFFAVGSPWIGIVPAIVTLSALTLLRNGFSKVHQHTTRIVQMAQPRNQELPRAIATEDSGSVRNRNRTPELTPTIQSVIRMVELRDPITGAHLQRLRQYTQLLLERLRRTEYAESLSEFLEDLPIASMLHDVGKVGIPDLILLKPGRLTSQEFDVIKKHTLYGGRTLEKILEQEPDDAVLQLGYEVALYHHERWDGAGYPFGLAGAKIPLSARIVAIPDVYDALTSERPYKQAYSHESTRAHIMEQSGTQFDPIVVQAFLACEHSFNRVRMVACKESMPAAAETTWAHPELKIVTHA